jgi:hypothetical protein
MLFQPRWAAKVTGTVRKAASLDGYEMFPHFSPDGKTVAFTGQYDDNAEIYTIPARRLRATSSVQFGRRKPHRTASSLHLHFARMTY